MTDSSSPAPVGAGTWRVVTGCDGDRSLVLFMGDGAYVSINLDTSEDEHEVGILHSTIGDAKAWVWSVDGFESVLDILRPDSAKAIPPYTRRAAAIEGRKRVDSTAPHRVVAYDPRTNAARNK